MSDLDVRPTPPPVACREEPRRPRSGLGWASVRNGGIAAAAMALFYVLVVRGASGSWQHLQDQVRADWYWLVAITIGFGLQVALVSELRHRHRHQHAAVPGAVGAGASTAGMIACCAHHLAELLPIIGAATAASFLTDYRVPFMVLGIAINAAAVVVAARALHRIASTPAPGGLR